MTESAGNSQEVDCLEDRIQAAPTLAIDSPKSLVEVPDRSWIKPERSQWQKLELYFKIVACHASNLSHLLRQRAVKMAHIQGRCEYFAWRMRCMSRVSLVIYQAIQSYGKEAELSDEMNEPLATSATLSLKNCLERFRCFDSFCRALPHRSDMDRISWSMIELRSSLEDLKTVAVGERPLDHVMYSAETGLLNAIRCVRDAAVGHKGLIAIISKNASVELTRTVDYARVPDFHLEVDQEALGTVSLKNSSSKSDRTPVLERQYPRDIEIEVMDFFAESNNLSIQEGYPKNPGVEVWTLTRTEEDGNPHRDPPREEETLLVSLNHGRPKKKKVSVSEEYILFARPNGAPNGNHISVPCTKILLVTQRPAGESTIALTVFWSSDSSNIYTIENAEIFFADMDSLITWKLELARVQEARLHARPDTVGNQSHQIGELTTDLPELQS